MFVLWKTRQEILTAMDVLFDTLKKQYDLDQFYVVGIPTACLMFLNDLLPYFQHHDCKIDLAFRKNKQTFEIPKKDKSVLCLVDTVYDTGKTLNTLYETYKNQYESIIGIVCVKRYNSPQPKFPLYSLFEFPKDNWLVGYGLDFEDSDYRWLQHLYYFEN